MLARSPSLACLAASVRRPVGTACVRSAAAELRPVTLLLGFRPDVQFAPFYVAQQEGFYADAGLEVTIEHRRRPTSSASWPMARPSSAWPMRPTS